LIRLARTRACKIDWVLAVSMDLVHHNSHELDGLPTLDVLLFLTTIHKELTVVAMSSELVR
jgi:hypothetical protein